MRFSQLALILILILASCGGEKKTSLTNFSPDKNVKVTLNAMRPNAVDAWKIDLKVKAYDFKEGELLFEAFASDINDQTVKFDWKGENLCFITITQRDGDPRRFQLIADSNQVQMAEI